MPEQYFAINRKVGDGVTTVWDFSFAGARPDAGDGTKTYLEQSDVRVALVDVDAVGIETRTEIPFELIGPTQVLVEPAVPNGQDFVIYRKTQGNFVISDFVDFASISERDLDDAFRQGLFAVQELRDESSDTRRVSNEARRDTAAALDIITEITGSEEPLRELVRKADLESGLDEVRDDLVTGLDEVRDDLANPDMGAAMVARGVVAVDSIADLLALPEGQRKEGLRYLVKGYHAGSDVGGGEFYWDTSRSGAGHNGGTVLDPVKAFPNDWSDSGEVGEWFSPGAGQGCFVAVDRATLSPENFGAVYGEDAAPSMMALINNHSNIEMRGDYLLGSETSVTMVRDIHIDARGADFSPVAGQEFESAFSFITDNASSDMSLEFSGGVFNCNSQFSTSIRAHGTGRLKSLVVNDVSVFNAGETPASTTVYAIRLRAPADFTEVSGNHIDSVTRTTEAGFCKGIAVENIDGVTAIHHNHCARVRRSGENQNADGIGIFSLPGSDSDFTVDVYGNSIMDCEGYSFKVQCPKANLYDNSVTLTSDASLAEGHTIFEAQRAGVTITNNKMFVSTPNITAPVRVIFSGQSPLETYALVKDNYLTSSENILIGTIVNITSSAVDTISYIAEGNLFKTTGTATFSQYMHRVITSVAASGFSSVDLRFSNNTIYGPTGRGIDLATASFNTDPGWADSLILQVHKEESYGPPASVFLPRDIYLKKLGVSGCYGAAGAATISTSDILPGSSFFFEGGTLTDIPESPGNFGNSVSICKPHSSYIELVTETQGVYIKAIKYRSSDWRRASFE